MVEEVKLQETEKKIDVKSRRELLRSKMRLMFSLGVISGCFISLGIYLLDKNIFYSIACFFFALLGYPIKRVKK